MRNCAASSLIALLAIASAHFALAGPLPPINLRVEYRVNPLGVDVENIRFSWVLDHTVRGSSQIGFQLIVVQDSISANPPFVVWDSDRISGPQQSSVIYEGQKLHSDTSYFWKVRYWDQLNSTSEFSEWASFDTGLFSPADWQGAQWLDGESGNQLRTTFSASSDADVTRARAYIASPGYYELRLNGDRVGDYVLGAFTTFEKRILYDTYDVTSMIREGKNALAISLGHGWYSEPSIALGGRTVILTVIIQFADGTQQIVISNNGTSPVSYQTTLPRVRDNKVVNVSTKVTSGVWKQIIGPIVQDNIYLGEVYDSRLETPAWDLPSYNDSTWHVIANTTTIQSQLSAQLIPPIRKIDEYTPISISEPGPGIFVFDFGQNLAGLSRLRISSFGPRVSGTNVTMQHSEMLDERGFVQNLYWNSPMIANYILDGRSSEILYEPKFTYFAFRYIQLTGYPGVPPLDCVRSYFVHTDVEEVSEIVFSDPLLNQIQHITRFAALSNFQNIPTDCPQRERRGWLGDAQLSSETDIHNFFMAPAYAKFLQDIRDTQETLMPQVNGSLPDCAPFYDHGSDNSDPAWGAAYTLLYHAMYKYYGDTRILLDHYDGVKTYLLSRISQLDANTGLLTYSLYGDWCPPNEPSQQPYCDSPSALVSSFYFATETELFSQIAGLLGYADDQAFFSKYSQATKEAFQAKFYDPTNKIYADGTLRLQTAIALAFTLGVVPQEDQAAVADNLVKDIMTTWNGHLSTGIVGTRFLFPVLTSLGRSDIALLINQQTTFPSFGYMVQNDATTLWEEWEGDKHTAIGSLNHIMFGSQSAWYYQGLGGITMSDTAIAYSEVVLAPFIASVNLSHVSTTLGTIRGPIELDWAKYPSGGDCFLVNEGETLSLNLPAPVTVANVTFASFGTPTGTCGNFSVGSCDAANSQQVMSFECLGRSTCSVPVTDTFFGDPCVGTIKYLFVEFKLTHQLLYSVKASVPVNTVATLYLPQLNKADLDVVISEGDSIIWENGKFSPTVGISEGTQTGGNIVLQLGSGSYSFYALIPNQ